MAFGGYDLRAGHAPSFSRVLADLTKTRTRVFSLSVHPAARILGLQGVPSQAPGSRASHCTVEGVLCDHGLASVIQAGQALAVDVHSGVRAATSRSSASWGQLWGGHRLERPEGVTRGPYPIQTGETDILSGLRLDRRAGLRGPPMRGSSLAGGRRSCGKSRSAWGWAGPPLTWPPSRTALT